MFHHRSQKEMSYFYLILGGGIRDAGRGMLLPPRDLMTGGLSPDMPRPRPPCTDSTVFPAI